MPRQLGNINDIVSLSNNLRELGKASSLSTKILIDEIDLFGFDVSKFHRMTDITILQATNKWGWDMRMALNNRHALEYFMFYRMLRFSYSISVLRTDILSKMNLLLKRLGYNATIAFSGIPTPEEYLDAIKKMEEKQLSFTEVSNLIHYSL